DRKSTRLNSSHLVISYAVFCLKKKKRRWRSGLGLSLVADYNNNDGVGGSSSTSFNSVDLWLKAEYLPTPRVGVSYQIASSAWKRSPSEQAGLTDHFVYKRRDGISRLF